MNGESLSSVWKRLFNGIVLFVLGFLCGVLVMSVADWSLGKMVVAIKSGEILDVDFIYFKSGDVFHGVVISQDDKEVVFDMDGSTLRFRPEEIERIDPNYYTRYLKRAW